MEASKVFYEVVLGTLGYTMIVEGEGYCGFSDGTVLDVWLVPKPEVTSQHVGFRAKDAAQVQAFYDAALAAGTTDNGAPGPRAIYNPEYYGGFIIDINGHNLETQVRKS